MRILGAFVVLIALLAAVWTFAPRPDPLRLAEEAEAERSRRSMLAGIRLMLATPDTPRIETPVISRSPETGQWEVRGIAVDPSGRTPFYAEISALCDQDFARPGCWRIDNMVMDGTETTMDRLVPPRASPASPSAADATDAPLPVRSPSQSTPPVAAAPLAEGADVAAADRGIGAAPENAPTPPADDAPAGSRPDHAVAAPAVNARQGPGVSFDVLTVLREGQQVRLLEESGDWGRYQVVGGDDDGRQVWIASRLLRPLDG